MSETAKHGSAWTRGESILAFDLYCRIPFQKTKASNAAVRELAAIIGRTPASIARKLGNFGAFDPELKRQNISGLTHTSVLDREIWDEFHDDWNSLVLEAHRLKEKLGCAPEVGEVLVSRQSRTERLTTRKQRIHQAFFRECVFNNYGSRCCITGISVSSCLIAAHIVPWNVSEELRADPTNGLCLSATFHCLFDAGVVGIAEDFTIVVSNSLRRAGTGPDAKYISEFHGQRIFPASKFNASASHIEWHRRNVFNA